MIRKMTIYTTNTKNYDQKIHPFVEEITKRKEIDLGKYNFNIILENDGQIGCYPMSCLEGKIVLSTSNCLKEIDDKLKELTD